MLDGRVRSVDLYNQSDSTLKYQTSKSMTPDWRNRRWTEQHDKEKKEPVVTVVLFYFKYIGLSSWLQLWVNEPHQ